MLLREMGMGSMEMEGGAYKESILQLIPPMYVPKTPAEADLLDQMIGGGIGRRLSPEEVANDYMEKVREARKSDKF